MLDTKPREGRLRRSGPSPLGPNTSRAPSLLVTRPIPRSAGGWPQRSEAILARHGVGLPAGVFFLVFATLAALTHSSRAGAQASATQPMPATPPAGADKSATLALPHEDPMLVPVPPAARSVASWDEALALIRARSPDYRSSYEDTVRAEAQKRIALAAVLPTLTGQGSYTHNFFQAHVVIPTTMSGLTTVPLVIPPADVFTVGGTLGWSVLNPRGLYAVGTAQRNVELERLSFEDRRRVIATSLVSAMLSTLAATRVTELNRVGLRAALDRLDLTQTRLEFGQGTALDVDRTSQDVEAARALIVTSDEALREAREALGAALALPEGVSPPGDLDLERFETAVAHTCHLNEDIEKRPDVLAASKQVELAQRRVTDAYLQISPYLNVGSQLAYTNEPVLAPNTAWSLQGTVVVPFYDGGARYGAMRDARAALEQARAGLVAARVNAIVGSAQAAREVGVVKASRDVAARQRDLAASVDRRTREGYAHGLGTSLDLVTSAQALRQAEIDLALLDFQFAQARANAVLVNAECVY
jgi:outer membrane protein TolC